MKLNSVTRFIVVSCTVLGTVVIATSQPGGANPQQRGNWPEHSMIPDKVGLNQMAEFQDAATLHLNDIIKNHGNGGGAGPQLKGKKTKFNETTIIHTSVALSAVTDTLVRYKQWETGAVAPGTGPMRPLTAAETAVLSYVFDEGVQMLRERGSGLATGKRDAATGQATGRRQTMAGPDGIVVDITGDDLGMSHQVFKRQVAQYIDAHPMRFWNEARVGLNSLK